MKGRVVVPCNPPLSQAQSFVCLKICALELSSDWIFYTTTADANKLSVKGYSIIYSNFGVHLWFSFCIGLCSSVRSTTIIHIFHTVTSPLERDALKKITCSWNSFVYVHSIKFQLVAYVFEPLSFESFLFPFVLLLPNWLHNLSRVLLPLPPQENTSYFMFQVR